MGAEMGSTTAYHELARSWPNAKYHQRTYRMRLAVLARLDETAHAHQVGVSDLVNFLLACALDQVERGTLEIPTTAPGLRRIDYDGL